MADEAASQSLTLAGQHLLKIDRGDEGDLIQIVTPDGSMPITISVTPAGVTLTVNAPRVTIDARGELGISAQRLLLRGHEGLTLESGGDLAVRAAGDLCTMAMAQSIRAESGSVDLKASDDVKVSGERVLVNCDETIDLHRRFPRR